MEIKKIILSQKSQKLQKNEDVFTFIVDINLNKYQIKKKLIETFPNLKIKKIRTMNYKPAYKKTDKKGKIINSKSKKKALVKLFSNQKDSFFKTKEQ